MRRSLCLMVTVVGLMAACSKTANVEQERNTLIQRDKDWSQSATDADKFVSFVADDGAVFPAGMPAANGAAGVRAFHAQLSSLPGFSVTWTPTKAEVGGAGDIGYTVGTYELNAGTFPAPEKGKYVTVWRKQPDGQWKVAYDVFNADTPGPGPTQHVMVAASAVAWGDAPPFLPAGAKAAVISGDPGKAAPFVIRLQAPAGYQIAAHWHPTDENVTVLSGTFAIGMGDKFD